MTSNSNLNRILQSNKAKKVKQLSEIAALFEKEQRVATQIREVEQFREGLCLELEVNEEFRKTLPRSFVEQENNKRNGLLEAAISFQLVAETKANGIRERQTEEHLKLTRLDNIIDRVDKEVRRQISIQDQVRELIDSEELPQSV